MEEGGFNRYSIMSGTPLFLLTAMRLHLTSCWGWGGWCSCASVRRMDAHSLVSAASDKFDMHADTHTRTRQHAVQHTEL